MNALDLAIHGDHPDVVKVLVEDEFKEALMINSPVSIQSQFQFVRHQNSARISNYYAHMKFPDFANMYFSGWLHFSDIVVAIEGYTAKSTMFYLCDLPTVVYLYRIV